MYLCKYGPTLNINIGPSNCIYTEVSWLKRESRKTQQKLERR